MVSYKQEFNKREGSDQTHNERSTEEFQEHKEKFQDVKNVPLTQMLQNISKDQVPPSTVAHTYSIGHP